MTEIFKSLKTLKTNFDSKTIDKHDYIHRMHDLHRLLFEYSEMLSQTDIQKIEIDSTGVYFTSKHRALTFQGVGPKFCLDSKDERIAPLEIFIFNTYEHDDFAMIRRLIKPGQSILDVGGNIGFHSVSLGLEFPTSKFYAFEPIPKTFSYLKKHVEINNLNNVSVHNFGFSNEEKDLTFFFYPEGSGNASSANLSEKENVQNITCHVSTIDKYVKENSLNVDFIKCDVEGAELFVFQGAQETLTSQKPIVFAEILRKWSKKFNYDPNEIFNLFYKLGYKAYTAKGSQLIPFEKMTENTIENNFFFIDPSKNIK